MEKGTLIGFVCGIVFILLSIILGEGVYAIPWFIDYPSIMITFGGAFAATMISFPLDQFLNGLKAIKLIFQESKFSPQEVIDTIIDLANVARKDGLLALEDRAQNTEDAFLKKGLLLLVDGTHPDLVRGIIETELVFLEQRHKDVQGVWSQLGSLGPAWGMIGTLLGLIILLQHMDEPDKLGPSMSVALVTTFYGSILANFVCAPTESKLKVRSAQEILMKQIMVEGLLSILAGENPRIIEEKLKAFLSPALRNAEKKEESAEAE
ncbi:MAG: motility protein A [Clostridia bacterium]|nr:motility protein A [Clostridia bacterium]